MARIHKHKVQAIKAKKASASQPNSKRFKADDKESMEEKALVKFRNTPLDVLLEICGYVTPSNLLYFARMNRTMRQCLMTKRRERIWKASRALHGIPDPTLAISEPAYASFLFDTGCQDSRCNSLCGTADFMVMGRYCGRCSINRQISMKAIMKECQNIPMDFFLSLPNDFMFKSLRNRTPPLMWRTTYEEVRDRILKLEKWNRKSLMDLIGDVKSEDDEKAERASVVRDWLYKFQAKQQRDLAKLYRAREQQMVVKLKNFKKEFTEDVLDGFKRSSGSVLWKKYVQRPHKVDDKDWRGMIGPLERAIDKYRRVQTRPFNLKALLVGRRETTASVGAPDGLSHVA